METTARKPPDAGRIAKLRALDEQARKIRESLGLSAKGEVVSQYELYVADDDKAVVEADGYGGALLSVVEGNYPVDYTTKHHRQFDREEDACKVAEALGEGWIEPARIDEEGMTLEGLLKRSDPDAAVLECQRCHYRSIEEDFEEERDDGKAVACPECGNTDIRPEED